MPSPTYKQNKKSIYNWRENNAEQFTITNKKYYLDNKVLICKKQKNNYNTNKEFKAFLKILL